jgi:endonuclease YncB( thermonuclease family)
MFKNLIVSTLLVLISTVSVYAEDEMPDMVEYDFEVTRVIDGDTVAFKADFLPEPLKQELSIRVYGVDTPEKSWRGKCDAEKVLGAAASQFTQNAIDSATTIKVAIYNWDKYGGRVLGDIIIDGVSLRQLLIENNYAREYYGDKKESWCD